MEFITLAQQVAALFAGTVLLENYSGATYYAESFENEALEAWGEPLQVYAVELRTDYDANAKEYEAAGVYYSEALGCYVWPVLSCGTSWNIASPQNIYEY